MKEEVFKIYKAENLENGLVYIGATTKEIEERMYDHIYKSKTCTGSYFQEAIGICGPDTFSWEQIDTANDINELANKEKDYIIKYNSFYNGYNSDSGGGIQKTVYQYSMGEGLLINQYDCLESAGNAVNVSKKSIANVCLGYNKTCKGFYWSYKFAEPFTIEKDLRRKDVVKFDLQGNQISTFESVAEASRQTGVSKTCIARCCRGERKCSGGFLWEYRT
ncbi:GIY-YIG nuclease family protein [Costertonia aggregata]|uniref:GIY-YIG nuclease family protein n=2 Tax=Costertonia aggregata TaxID=343403 RepID=A0A7H9AVW5_9FLAO|nr:GIY-YIG nuclease family protein [Costertonia aggregata]